MNYGIDETLNHMLLLTQHIRRKDVSAVLLAILMDLNFPEHKDGFELLMDAILIKMRNRNMRMSSIYEKIEENAKESTEKVQIEQSIRATIKLAWERRNHEKWLYFFSEQDICEKYPSNKVFVSRMCYLLVLLNACDKESNETK